MPCPVVDIGVGRVFWVKSPRDKRSFPSYLTPRDCQSGRDRLMPMLSTSSCLKHGKMSMLNLGYQTQGLQRHLNQTAHHLINGLYWPYKQSQTIEDMLVWLLLASVVSYLSLSSESATWRGSLWAFPVHVFLFVRYALNWGFSLIPWGSHVFIFPYPR